MALFYAPRDQQVVLYDDRHSLTIMETALQLLNTFLWVVLTQFLLYAVVLSNLSDSYRLIVLQTREGRSCLSKMKVKCNCCCNDKRSTRTHKGWERTKKLSNDAWWQFLAWMASWLPKFINEKVKQRTDLKTLEALEEIERQIDIEMATKTNDTQQT